MAELTATIRSLFSGRVQEEGDTYTIEVPKTEVEAGTLRPGATYRVAVLEAVEDAPARAETTASAPDERSGARQSGPPVAEGDVREVTVESIGDQGDGIAKVERGFVVIVPDARPGDRPTVRIDDVRETVAFATVVDDR
jgi:predicted RNA-binding protein with TRAM domain